MMQSFSVRFAMPKRSKAKQNGSRGRVEGEGSYSATRAYNENLARALSDKRSIEQGAERARRAVEGTEGPALRKAEKRGKSGPRGVSRGR